MASLTIHELRKRNNLDVLLKKIQTSQHFELTKEKQTELGKENVVVKPNPDLIERLTKASLNPDVSIYEILGCHVHNKCLLLETETGTITSGALQKTWEFGSKTPEMVYSKETKEQKNIQAALRKTTVFGLKPVTLLVKTTTNNLYRYKDVFSLRMPTATKGELGKADFEFLDKDGNVLFRVSHKDGRRPRHFRQWSGLRDFKDHPEVKQFGIDLKQFLTKDNPGLPIGVFPTRLSVGKEIKDEELKKLAIFGNKEVDFLIQGECGFIKSNDFEFIMSAPLILAAQESLDALPEGYQPVFLARRGDLKRGAFGIKGCRGMIYPRSGRKFHNFL